MTFFWEQMSSSERQGWGSFKLPIVSNSQSRIVHCIKRVQLIESGLYNEWSTCGQALSSFLHLSLPWSPLEIQRMSLQQLVPWPFQLLNETSYIPSLLKPTDCVVTFLQFEIQIASACISGVAYIAALYLYVVCFRAVERRYRAGETQSSISEWKRRWFFLFYISVLILLSTVAFVEYAVTIGLTLTGVDPPVRCAYVTLVGGPFLSFPLTIWIADAFMVSSNLSRLVILLI